MGEDGPGAPGAPGTLTVAPWEHAANLGIPVSSPSCSTRDSLPLSSGRTLSCRILGFSALFPWRPKGCSWRTLCGPHAVSTTGLGAAQVGRGYAESWQRCTFSQLSRAGEVKKTNSGVVQTIMLPSADTSMLVTGPGHPTYARPFYIGALTGANEDECQAKTLSTTDNLTVEHA